MLGLSGDGELVGGSRVGDGADGIVVASGNGELAGSSRVGGTASAVGGTHPAATASARLSPARATSMLARNAMSLLRSSEDIGRLIHNIDERQPGRVPKEDAGWNVADRLRGGAQTDLARIIQQA